MSKVLKANQLTVSGLWRPRATTQPMKRPISQVETICKSKDIAQEQQTAQARAAELVIKAKREADAILAAADSELKRQQEIGYAAGWEAGYEAGLAKGEAIWQARLEDLEVLRQRLIEQDANWLQEASQETLELVVAVAERVIGFKLSHDDAVVQAALRQGLGAAKGCREALLTVSSEDFPELWERRAEWKSLLPGVKEFDLQPDPSLASGDLVLQTNQGTLDARLDTVLEQVAAQLCPED